jgi:hypothetical protein
MRKNTLFLILAIVVVSACKKAETIKPMPDPAPLTDFLYLPVRDAEWRVHLRGTIDGCFEPYGKDTAYNLYSTIKCTGTDTLISGKKYYRYEESSYEVYTVQPYNTRYYSGNSYYLREDTAAQRIYVYSGSVGEIVDEQLVVDFNTEKIGDSASVAPFWPASYISGFNDVIINGQSAKMWEVAYKYDAHKKFFYKAYGIGSQAGMLPKLELKYSEPVSLDFIYKGQTNHFDFDIHNDPQVFQL